QSAVLPTELQRNRVESYLSGEKTFVKHQFIRSGATAASIDNLLSFPTIITENTLQDIHFSIII
ncbi:DUF5951 family protein, partial [Klebsiella pneumoniae]|uniref:DUF5951 family protein n=2 Tax=Klebsiella pneumoniae TaxID=573 RepID=UPI00098340C5